MQLHTQRHMAITTCSDDAENDYIHRKIGAISRDRGLGPGRLVVGAPSGGSEAGRTRPAHSVTLGAIHPLLLSLVRNAFEPRVGSALNAQVPTQDPLSNPSDEPTAGTTLGNGVCSGW